jgi:hypothetical protein
MPEWPVGARASRTPGTGRGLSSEFRGNCP